MDQARSAGTTIVELFPGDEVQGALGHWVLGLLGLSLGNWEGAAERYARAAAIVAQLGQREPARFRFHPDQIEALIQLGDVDAAQTLLVTFEERARIFPRPWILATAARCRALLLAARGDLDGAVAAIEAAQTHHRGLEMPFELARTRLVEGMLFRRLKQKRRARSSLEEARASFEQLGASLWAGRAADELRRVTVRRAPAELTATELQVAQLAAAGLTNRAIAQQAFVSVKTVEASLSRTYRKLGISSRAQLGRVLDQEKNQTTA